MSANSPYPEQSLDFLQKCQSGGSWVLTALGNGPPISATFSPSTTDALKSWIETQSQAGRDIYFRCAFANKCTGIDESMQDEDVTAVNLLWCDIDLKGKNKLEKTSVLSHVKKKLGALQPSCINDSGNGFHLFWQLGTTIKIGQGFALNDLSMRLYGLAKRLGGDTKCRNPSRLLRLPGTWNVKDKSKPLLCHTIETTDAKYSITDFDNYRDDSFLSKTPVAISEISPSSTYTLSELGLSDDLLTKIQTGVNPANGLKWVDRSQLMNHIAVELVKAGVQNEIILAILLDKQYLHAGHLYDCRDLLREARRTLNWALNAGASDAVSRINRNYYMVCVGGHIIYGYDDRESSTPKAPREIINKGDFLIETKHIKESYVNEKGEEISINVFNKWVENEKRRRFYPDGYIIDPTYSHGDGFYNLWRGYGVRASRNVWAYMHENIRCLCEGNREYSDYVLNWCALLVQHPTQIPRTALVFHGDQGTGKSLFADSLCRIMGIHSTVVKQPDQLAGRFSGHLQGKIFIQADECEFDTKGMGVLKALISDPTMPVEKKGTQIFSCPNYSHIILTSNADKVLPLDPTNRRFVIFQPLTDHKGDTGPNGFWANLIDEMENGGYEGMLYDLLKRDIAGWSPEYGKPETRSMIRHKKHSLSNTKAVVKLWIERGDYSLLALSRLRDDYRGQMREIDDLLDELGIVVGKEPPPREMIAERFLKSVGISLEWKI